MLLFLARTGARVSEALGVDACDLQLDRPRPQVLLRGKGRKERIVPIPEDLAKALQALMSERGLGSHEAKSLFVGTHGARLTRFGATHIVRRAVATATANMPELARKSISPHVMRHYLPRPTMSSSLDRNYKRLRNKEIFRRSTRATRHSQRDLEAVQELQQIVVGPKAG